jgi:hypothetical protein
VATAVYRTRLLLWSGLCFAWLAVSNMLLFVDLAIVGDDTDLRWARSTTSLAGTFVYLARALAFGLILAAIVDNNRIRSSVE